jgi:DNA repair protein RecN (Recombination protein N)
MLRSLRIQHFALIDEVQLHFEPGFSVFTGETGSGKSIILAATQLVLGDRADLSVLAPGAKKAIVEAVFELSNDYLPFFEAHDLDFDVQTLVRREILAEGKSRAFINDSPVSLQVLKQLTTQLLQIHSQYNTLELKSKKYQLALTDLLLGLEQQQQQFAKEFQALQLLEKEVAQLQQVLEQARAQQDYNQFLLEELEALNLKDPKVQQLEQDLAKFSNASHLEEARAALSSILDDNGPYAQLYSRKALLDKVKNIDANMLDFAERLNALLIELKELSNDASNEAYHEINPSELALLEARQDKINNALLKHRARDIAELLDLQAALSVKTAGLAAQELALQEKQIQRDAQLKALWQTAKELHAAREKGVPKLADQLAQILNELKLPHTKLAFNLQQLDTLNSTGCTQIELLFSANLGHDPVPVERAASGGELSRLMLALQKMSSEKRALPTIIFDEIDTGVSGDVALKIGKLLSEMSAKGQCMAISHLPQVAARAVHHFVVQKSVVNERMQTSVATLNAAERIEEIARLLSGEVITAAAKENAKALLQGA